MDPGALSTLDAAVLAILGLALLRGLWIGLVREAFSIGAVAAACVVVRIGLVPASLWVAEASPVELGDGATRVLAAVGLATLTLLVVGFAGRLIRRGLRAVGLGPMDRVLGGLLGTAEGALVVGLLLFGASTLLGRDHPSLEESRAFDVYEQAEVQVRGRPDVASGPPGG